MVTRFLIILNVIGYLWEISVAGPGMLSAMGGSNMERVLIDGSLIPAAVRGGQCNGVSIDGGEWWRIFTGAFLHAGLIHIGVNMISLWSLGRFIEFAMGSWRMLVIYLLSIVASGLGIVYLSADCVPTLGASGAIFGLFGALFAIGFKLGKPGMDLVRANVGILMLNLIMTFAIPGISKAAHLAGLLAGFVLTYLIYYPPRRVRPVVTDASTGAELETEYQSPQQRPPP
jgi:membrane associated rhomboid family serine protease